MCLKTRWKHLVQLLFLNAFICCKIFRSVSTFICSNFFFHLKQGLCSGLQRVACREGDVVVSQPFSTVVAFVGHRNLWTQPSTQAFSSRSQFITSPNESPGEYESQYAIRWRDEISRQVELAGRELLGTRLLWTLTFSFTRFTMFIQR